MIEDYDEVNHFIHNKIEKYNEKFGGVLYIFLRGMPQHKGVYFKRPSWQNLNEYENRLRLENY